jgi:hypothetical protein
MKKNFTLRTGLGLGVLVALWIATLITPVFTPQKVTALSGTDFNAGRIIDDGVFFNANTLSPSEIQQFLNAKVPVCDTNGSKIYSGSTTRAQYGASRGYPTPYTCLKDYSQSVPSIVNSGSDLCQGSITSGYKSAAQIIYDVSQACWINPKVLLVLLQKEQSLVTDDWPWSIQYRSATGYGCPDTAPCDAEYYGFFNQVYQAAMAYRRYQANSTNYNYRANRNNTILWHPNSACGSSTVYIENQATAGLYIYTPYRPNQAALYNLYGSGDGCSSYGNRNFWRMYSDWFGSTYGDGFQALSGPRWMQVKGTGVKKVYVFSGDSVGDNLAVGQQIRFIDKILINGKWYLRTEYNHNNGGLYGIPQDQLEEIPYQPITPKWITFSSDGNRSYPASRTSVGDLLVRGTSVKVVDQITVYGSIYYRTEYNHDHDQSIGIHSKFVTDFAPILLDGPRNFCSNTTISKLNPLTGINISTASAGTYMINKKVLISGLWYYQTDADNGSSTFFSSADLHDVCYVPFQGPRDMRLNKDVVRFNPYTNEKYDTLTKNSIIAFSSKIFFNNQWYFRTTYNTQNNTDAVIPASAASEL